VERADVVIVGGGIVGLSVAWHLADLGCRDVLVLEAEPVLAAGTTGRSVGGFRQQVDDPVLLELSRRSVPFYLEFEERLGQAIDLRQDGYLILATTEGGWAGLSAGIERQRRWGADVRAVSPQEVAALAPGVRTDDVHGGSYCPQDGFLDPSCAALGLAAGARRLGVRIATRRPATELVSAGGRVTGVRTPAGEVAAGAVVVAAGPFSGRVVGRLGPPLPLALCKRQVFVADPVDALPPGSPFVLTDEPPFYVRADVGALLLSAAEEEETGYDLTVDWSALETVAERALHRVPALVDAGIRRGWAGVRTLTPDRRPLVGPVAPGLHVAAGFNGKGVMHAPAIGALAARLATGRSAPGWADALSPGRFGT